MRIINIRPSRPTVVVLALLPFVAIFIAYTVASDIRLAANPADKLLPAPETVMETAGRLVTEADRRSGDILFWQDTWASLQRLLLGVGISSAIGLVFGLLIGLLPVARALLAQVVAVISMIPPLALLPILFIVFGLGELSKVVLIVIGTLPFLIRDLSQRVLEVPQELVVKAQTLGASTWVIAVRVALPQLMPRLIQAVRLSLGPAWLFLIAAEAIAADAGLGYRIFLVRRYLAMDVILTYVMWITLLAFLMDWALRSLSRRTFPWAEDGL
ncbi:ABC transporter permease [Profundibacterium mesophilum]|uniref:ABC transporter permease protein n=1 Tax=Profundibacterium mesophilum KAUST100406-0324 TaxID=1037889 RepID=A0A921NVT2_9RHOB|nr:ABC transporter permease subunit [Profundibacterium mesophilum]KAF0674483.1 ABC transporter permease protein [Profundibacterium mesophilum KAUST100406-0324]